MNTIGKIGFDFTADNEIFVRDLYGRWDGFFAVSIEKVICDVIEELIPEDGRYEIGELSVNIGEIMEGRFYEDFPAIFRARFYDALTTAVEQQGAIRRTDGEHYGDDAFSLLSGFLTSGAFPAGLPRKYGTLDSLFMHVLRHDGARFKKFLLTYGHYSSLQDRLVHQFSDDALEGGVGILLPADGRFVCAYVRMLKARYETIERPAVTRTEYRYAVWKVVYSYILDRRGSYFNRKTFLMRTIADLGARLNTSYDALVDIVTRNMDQITDPIAGIPELLLMLEELRNDVIGNKVKKSTADMAEFYRLVAEAFKEGAIESKDSPVLQAMIEILAVESSCRSFLVRLKEDEIYSVVQAVMPEHSGFVIAYAKELDRQTSRSAFEGKAGGEFRLIKWIFIFPVLLDERSSAFNRRYFVRAVLLQLASRYNIEMNRLLPFLLKDESLAKLDPKLLEIFRWILESTAKEENKTEYASGLSIDQVAGWLRKTDCEDITREQKEYIVYLLSTDISRHRLLVIINENERIKLLLLMFFDASESVISYAKSLDRMKGRNGVEGSSGNFGFVKWDAIFSVLMHVGESAFNYASFVEGVFRRLSAHYNTEYADLLQMFLPFEAGLSPELREIISGLYNREITLRFTQARRMLSPHRREELIRVFVPEYSETLLLLVGLLERYYEKYADVFGNAAGRPASFEISRSSFAETVWKKIFDALGELKDWQNVDVGRLIASILEKLSRELSVVSEELNAGLRALLDDNGGNYSASLISSLNGFYKGANVGAHKLRGAETKTGNKSEQQNRLTDKKENVMDNATEKKICVDDAATKSGETPVTTEKETDTSLPYSQPISVNNAGLVLLAPYLPRLFDMLELMRDRAFSSDDSRIRAVFLMQYAVFGTASFPENEMVFNKVIAGMGNDDTLPVELFLTEKETNTVESLLKGVLSNWPKMGNSSTAALREAFLQRVGILEFKVDRIDLTVEQKAYDVLLDSLPWSYSTVKFPWMDKPLFVKWR